jgi:EpsI family protein
MSFTFLFAYLLNIKLWMRIIVFLSCIPIAICMNSARIGVTGLLIEQGRIELAEGFFHYFEGWIIFMTCVAILVGEVWLLTKIGRIGSLRSALMVDFRKQQTTKLNEKAVSLPSSYLSALFLLFMSALFTGLLSMPYIYSQMPPVANPPRVPFASFPMEIGEWNGERMSLRPDELDDLKPEDYLIAEYRKSSGEWVNLYAAYWKIISKGSGPHSPKACLPGSGWKILNASLVAVDGISISGNPLIVNRLQIEKNGDRMVVHYWDIQCGRLIRGDRLRRFYRFWDRLSNQRTDYAFVRLITRLSSIEDWQAGDERILAFSDRVYPKLVPYVAP